MQYVIELESTKLGLLTLMNDVHSHIHLDMSPAGNGRASRIPITTEQFNLLAYDIEGHSEGRYGVKKDLKIHILNVSTGDSEELSFADARLFVDTGVFSDTKAAELQAKQDAEIEAARVARLKEKQDAAAASGGDG